MKTASARLAPAKTSPDKTAPDKKAPDKKAPDKKAQGKSVTLKDVARHVELSPTTVSVVLNRTPVADSIPQETKDRVFAAARELNYRPNYLARSLRGKRSFSVGVLVPEISEGYAAGVMSGVEDHLIEAGYFYLMASHRSRANLLAEYLRHLEDRSVEGFILVATHLEEAPPLPTVVISGHRQFDNVTNVVVDHDIAARLALSHLAELGHERIAFFRGAEGNIDAAERWHKVAGTAHSMGITLRPELTLQLTGTSYGPVFSPEEGYQEGHAYGRKLLETGVDFSALFAFNDVSAIGAIRAFLDAGLRVPEDISVVGFDDIQSAAFHNPSLTTVRQPLYEMGQTAGEMLLQQITGKKGFTDRACIEPKLIVRASTGPARC
ncbi:MAG: substrate-binding domain-containing protein [Acidobacteriota bacterium]